MSGTLQTCVNCEFVSEEEDRTVVERMRARAEQCRRLAKAILDPSASAVLLKMAEEVEADIARLEGGPNPDAIETIPLPPQS
jgi:hypothetical protein